MMIAPQTLAKVGKLIRLLSSDKPGEAIGAVHAIRRTLSSVDLDLHDLANVIETAGEIKIMPPDETTDWQALAARLLREHGGALNGKEIGFLSTMSRWCGTPSPRQRKWLDDIAQRFARAA